MSKDFVFPRLPANNLSLACRKNIFGVGINDAWYMTKHKDENGIFHVCHIYKKWKEMIRRCYDEKYHEKFPTYARCSICKEWIYFSSFLLWFENQEYNNIGYVLDKDLKIIGNREYSSNACLLIPCSINSFITDSRKVRGLYKQGVCFNKKDRKFMSHCMFNGKKEYMGSFNAEEDAFIAYKEFKMKVAIHLGKEYPYLKEYLINYVNSIK